MAGIAFITYLPPFDCRLEAYRQRWGPIDSAGYWRLATSETAILAAVAVAVYTRL